MRMVIRWERKTMSISGVVLAPGAAVAPKAHPVKIPPDVSRHRLIIMPRTTRATDLSQIPESVSDLHAHLR
jgi:hypothetical protein